MRRQTSEHQVVEARLRWAVQVVRWTGANQKRRRQVQYLISAMNAAVIFPTASQIAKMEV